MEERSGIEIRTSEKRRETKSVQTMELEFPIEIMQHIQSFLDGEEAARTCLFSKSWFTAWSTRPILVFDKIPIGNEPVIMNAEHWNSLRSFVKRYKESNLHLEKLVLRTGLTYSGCKGYTSLIDQLLADATTLGITQLDLIAPSYCDHFPIQVFGITSLTDLSIRMEGSRYDWGWTSPAYFYVQLNGRVLCSRLVSLKLYQTYIRDIMIIDILLGCPLIENLELSHLDVYSTDINVDESINDVVVLCPRLISLSLKNVSVEDNLIRDILSGSPLVENLDMENCLDLTTINVSKMPNLGDLHIRCCFSPAIVSFESINNVPAFHKLRSMTLHKVVINNELFVTFSSRFPCIEKLTLDYCTDCEEIRISSRTLKYFQLLHDNKKLRGAELDVPNIKRFVFNQKCNRIPSLSFHTASREWESEVELSCSLGLVKSSWFVKLRDFLKEISLSRVSLHVPLEHWNVIYVDGFPISPTPVVENLRITKQYVSHALLCALFRCCRPTFITLGDAKLDSHTYSWAKLMYELFIMNQKVVTNDVSCFSVVQSLLIYDLEEIDVVLGDETVPLRKFLKDSPLFPCDKKQVVRFLFKWGAFRC